MLHTHSATAVCDRPITCTLKRMFDSLEQAREAATEFIADEHLDEAMKVLRPGIGLRPTAPDSPSVVGGSRLGGEPDLPGGIDWPRPELGSLPYAFICQIDCTEAHALGELAADLPDHGRILVFYDVQLGEDGDAARAAHVLWDDTAADQLHTATMPDDLAEAAAHGTGGGDGYPPDCYHSEARPLTLFRGVTPPGNDDPVLDAFMESPVSDGWEDEFGMFAMECGVFITPDWRHHQLLGAPQQEQYDPREDMELQPDDTVCDWRLLLQLSLPDWQAEDFGEGSVYFLIRTDDLAHRRFDRVQAVYQQT